MTICLSHPGKEVQIKESVAEAIALNFVASVKGSFCRMLNHAGPNHVQIDLYQTMARMLAGFDGCSMVAFFPAGAHALLSLIGGHPETPAGHKLWPDLAPRNRPAGDYRGAIIREFIQISKA